MDGKTRVGIEIEKKYIIALPDVSKLEKMENYTVSEILQIYLPSDDGSTHRVRRRTYAESVECTETRKIRIDRMSSTEIEREISEAEFDTLASNPKAGTLPIRKVRHTFSYLGQTFEIDVYPRWKRSAIMETELESREFDVVFPDVIEILCDVTGDKSYSNASMARSFPQEISL